MSENDSDYKNKFENAVSNQPRAQSSAVYESRRVMMQDQSRRDALFKKASDGMSAYTEDQKKLTLQ